jgi:hypothetical protein
MHKHLLQAKATPLRWWKKGRTNGQVSKKHQTYMKFKAVSNNMWVLHITDVTTTSGSTRKYNRLLPKKHPMKGQIHGLDKWMTP